MDSQTSQPQEVGRRPAPVLRSLGALGVVDPVTGETTLGAGKPLALLVYLAAAPGYTAGREHLLDLLWSDLGPAPARHALNQTVWYLRQRLGDEAILTTDHSVGLGISFDCDRARFLEAIDARDLERAVDLYGGEFLAGFALPGSAAFEHWADAERQHLRLRFQRAAESLARERLHQGRSREARDLARRMRDADPFDERGWRLLIECCLAHDDRVSALAEAQHLEGLLSADERVPEPATQAVLRRARELPEETERSGNELVAELVGREREFGALLSAWERARGGVAQVASLVAAAGLGKTRLLRDLGNRLRAVGLQAIYVRAHPGDRDVPWAYAAEVARALAIRPGARGVAPASAASLVALDPSLSAHYAATADPATGDDVRRRRSAAVADLVQAVADERPLALLLDDMHWADEASRDALQRAATQLERCPALVVVSSRTAAALDRLERLVEVRLDRLGRDEVEALVASLGILPDAPWARDLADGLTEATGGSPLLLIETLQLAIETGCLARVEGRWEGTDGEALRELLKAGSALQRRVADLERAQAWLLLLLVAAGTPQPLDLLVAAGNVAPEQAQTDLTALERRGLIERHGGTWLVAHDEIAARVEEHATPQQLHAAHVALGRALLAHTREPSALRTAARHLATAGAANELSVAAAAWIRAVRERGDARASRAVVAELLGLATNDPGTRRLVRTLPWRLRFRWRKPLAAAALVALVAAWGVYGALRGPDDGVGVIVATWRQEPSGHWRMYSAELTERDLALGVLQIASLRRTSVVSWDRPSGGIRPGSPETLAMVRAYPDSGGEEIALSGAGTDQPVRLTYRPGDDLLGSWSPDGRYLAVMTDRWTQLSHSDIAVLSPERADSVVARLTSDPSSRDATPQWSPDGTRIAFSRMHYDGHVPLGETCIVTVDGREERCLAGWERVSLSLVGWASAIEVVVVFQHAEGVPQIVAVNVGTGASRVLAEGAVLDLSQAPGWVACVCRRTATEPLQFRVFSAGDPDHGVRIEPSEPVSEVSIFATGHPHRYLDRLSIQAASRTLPVDGPYQVVLRGADGEGTPVVPQAVHWWSGDTAVAWVDTAGVVHPRRAGTVVIHASAGGWRQDSTTIRVGQAEIATVMAEDWAGDFTERWVPFGEPRPFVARAGGRTVLAPNGDSTFLSGVYLARPLPAREGFGLEFDASVPRTRPQWQTLMVALRPADSLVVRSWDLRNGQLPDWSDRWHSCYFQYPSPEGAVRAESAALSAGMGQSVSTPPALYTGAWFRVRLQFFQDGRCGLALNGRARVISESRVAMGDSATILLMAVSHHTRVLIGHLEAWTGVRRDIDWSVVNRRH